MTSLGVRVALTLLGTRLVLITVAAVAGGGLLAAINGTFVMPPGSMMATWTILPVNLVSLGLVVWIARRARLDVRTLVCGAQCRPVRDLGWGLLWSFVLGLPFVGVLTGALWVLTGDPMAAMVDGFVTSQTEVPLPAGVAAVVGAATLVSFIPLNGPTEELLFRGLAQQSLASLGVAGVVIPALVFGVQHAWFAASVPMSIAMALAFAAWGLGAGLIVRWQGRLLPMIIGHVVVNAGTSAPAAALPIVAG